MPTGVYIYLQGFRQLRDKLGRFSIAVDAEAKSILQDGAELAVRSARTNAPKDLGAGAQHIHVEAQALAVGAYSIAVIAPDRYMIVQEYGRKPGRKPPSTRQIAGWGSRHGFGTKRALYVLARSIGRKGFRGKYFMHTAQYDAEIYIKRRLVRASARLAAYWR